MRFRLRRLLLLPAVALVALGAPVLATAQTAPAPATTDEVPVAPEGTTVGAGWSSEATPVDGQLVGVTWEGDPATEFTVEVRETDGTWVEPTAVEGAEEADEGSKDAVHAAEVPGNATEPVWVGNDVDAVRVSLASGEATDVSVVAVDAAPGSAPSGSAGASSLWISDLGSPERYAFAGALFAAAAALTVLALGGGLRSRRSRRLCAVVVAALALGACVPVRVSPPGNGAAMPSIVTRAQWGARPFACVGGPEYAPALKFAVVHHTVNSNTYSAAQVPQMMRSIQAYHMDANGYCDIAYHFIVDRFGGTWEARAGGMDRPVIGGHSGGFNSGSTSAALLGDYTGTYPSTEQWNSLVHLLRWRMSVGGVHPHQSFIHQVASSPCNCQNWAPGTVISLPVSIVGHRDLDQTACPGNTFWPELAPLRNQVAAGYVPPTTATTASASEITTTTTSTSTSTTVPSSTTTSSSLP